VQPGVSTVFSFTNHLHFCRDEQEQIESNDAAREGAENEGSDAEDEEMQEDGEDIDDSDLPPELRMNEYDDEDDNEVHGFTNNHDVIDEVEDDIAVCHFYILIPYSKSLLECLSSLSQLQVMQQGDVAYADEDEWDAEDLEDNEIKASDALLVVAMTEDEFSHLEVQLFSEEGNLFVTTLLCLISLFPWLGWIAHLSRHLMALSLAWATTLQWEHSARRLRSGTWTCWIP